jgi:hypothetical protein
MAALSACASQIQGSDLPEVQAAIAAAEARGLHVLSPAEVRRTIIGATIGEPSRVQQSRLPHLTESFLPNGRYQATSPGIQINGTYRIISNRACISAGTYPEYCAVFFADDQNSILRYIPGQNIVPARITIIRR